MFRIVSWLLQSAWRTQLVHIGCLYRGVSNIKLGQTVLNTTLCSGYLIQYRITDTCTDPISDNPATVSPVTFLY